ncbi:DUF4056 domain-containing protein [Ideonella sp. B7]|uniref:DUF4056 domain-containing protein n=1 Tax=Ideonella benzenivorans TaxID=2831643 RepID=UPI001CECE67B|nr:DUF4056 domain-containing protein [Ideonella benzenivorans]MCA6218065.1 DUF4056 domain-containing protein [Ideonella benzenivorans]
MTTRLVSLLLALALTGPVWARPPAPGEWPPTPVGRGGTLPTPYTLFFLPNTLADPSDLGTHAWRDHSQETLGIVYSCRMGFLDLVHIRNAADWTLHLYVLFLRALQDGTPTLDFDGGERGVHFQVRFPAPLSAEERATLAPTLALQLARRHADWVLAWHEVLTWYGYSTLWGVSEHASAFSVDDLPSHRVGLTLAERALADPDHELLPALTAQLAPLLAELQVQPRAVTTEAMERVKGLWWNPRSGWPANGFISRRYLGMEDAGQLSLAPWRVPGLPACEGGPAAQLPVDRLDQWADGRFAHWATTVLTPGMDSVLRDSFGPEAPQTRAGTLQLPDDLPAVVAELRRRMRDELGPRADQPD